MLAVVLVVLSLFAMKESDERLKRAETIEARAAESAARLAKEKAESKTYSMTYTLTDSDLVRKPKQMYITASTRIGSALGVKIAKDLKPDPVYDGTELVGYKLNVESRKIID